MGDNTQADPNIPSNPQIRPPSAAPSRQLVSRLLATRGGTYHQQSGLHAPIVRRITRRRHLSRFDVCVTPEQSHSNECGGPDVLSHRSRFQAF